MAHNRDTSFVADSLELREALRHGTRASFEVARHMGGFGQRP
jgi:hypothetical protein